MHQRTSAIFPSLSGYLCRPATRDDIPSIHALYLAAQQADHTGRIITVDDLYREFQDPWLEWSQDSLLVVAPTGEVAALARVFCDPHPTERLRAELWGEVHPAHRGRGLGESILSWMEAHGRERVLESTLDLPRDMVYRTMAHLQDRIDLFTRHGFAPIRYFFRMRRNLREPIPEQPLPEKLTLQTYDASIDRALLDAFNASFADHWGFSHHSEEEWRIYFIGRSTFRPDWTYVAMEGNQVAGFSINRHEQEDMDGQLVRTGHLGQIGVVRAWRNRGVATALICESLRTFHRAGLDWACLGVDAENPTGALGLYEGLGFAPFKRMITFGKEIK